jgi:hypothetical protein
MFSYFISLLNIFEYFETGIDVVLDPLNGENSIKGFELLRPLGRIVHFGKDKFQ